MLEFQNENKNMIGPCVALWPEAPDIGSIGHTQILLLTPWSHIVAKLSPSSSFSSAELALISHLTTASRPPGHPSEYQNGYIW
jgi:hypothetical protein